MPLNEKITLHSQTFHLVRILDPGEFFDVQELIMRNRYVGQVIKMLDAFQRLQVIMAQKEFLDIRVLLLQMWVQCGYIQLTDLTVIH